MYSTYHINYYSPLALHVPKYSTLFWSGKIVIWDPVSIQGFLAQLSKQGPHLGTLSSLTSACAAAQRWRNALQVSLGGLYLGMTAVGWWLVIGHHILHVEVGSEKYHAQRLLRRPHKLLEDENQVLKKGVCQVLNIFTSTRGRISGWPIIYIFCIQYTVSFQIGWNDHIIWINLMFFLLDLSKFCFIFWYIRLRWGLSLVCPWMGSCWALWSTPVRCAVCFKFKHLANQLRAG